MCTFLFFRQGNQQSSVYHTPLYCGNDTLCSLPIRLRPNLHRDAVFFGPATAAAASGSAANGLLQRAGGRCRAEGHE
jgi:hypothetical protein